MLDGFYNCFHDLGAKEFIYNPKNTISDGFRVGSKKVKQIIIENGYTFCLEDSTKVFFEHPVFDEHFVFFKDGRHRIIWVHDTTELSENIKKTNGKARD